MSDFKLHRLRVKVPHWYCRDAEVELDGRPLQGVQSVKIELDVDRANTVTIVLGGVVVEDVDVVAGVVGTAPPDPAPSPAR